MSAGNKIPAQAGGAVKVPVRVPQDETFEKLETLFSQHMANFNANRDNTKVRAEIDALLAGRQGAGALPASPKNPHAQHLSYLHDAHGSFETAWQKQQATLGLAATPPSATAEPIDLPVLQLAQRITELCNQHGSLRAAARVLEVDPGYLSRISSGESKNPGDKLLRRMGLREITTYERTK